MAKFFSLAMAVVVGVALADLVIPSHVAGTQALVNGANTTEKQSLNALLGQTS